MRKPIELRTVSKDEISELDRQYHQTKDVRLRTRIQMILLAAEEQMAAPQIAKLVRMNEQTVRIWLKRFNAEGISGLADEPRTGAPARVTPVYTQRLLEIVRLRPRALEQPYSMWTLQRLADFLASELGLRFSIVTVARLLQTHGIVLSRPQHQVTSPDPEYTVKKRRLKTSATT
jgi:transposase